MPEKSRPYRGVACFYRAIGVCWYAIIWFIVTEHPFFVLCREIFNYAAGMAFDVAALHSCFVLRIVNVLIADEADLKGLAQEAGHLALFMDSVCLCSSLLVEIASLSSGANAELDQHRLSFTSGP